MRSPPLWPIYGILTPCSVCLGKTPILTDLAGGGSATRHQQMTALQLAGCLPRLDATIIALVQVDASVIALVQIDSNLIPLIEVVGTIIALVQIDVTVTYTWHLVQVYVAVVIGLI